MTPIEPILAFHYFVKDAYRADGSPPIDLFFDTNIVYTALLGLNDYFGSSNITSEKARLRWFTGESSLLSAIIRERVYLLDMLQPHRLELFYILKHKNPNYDLKSALREFTGTNVLPPVLEWSQTPSGYEFILELERDRDLAGLKALMRIVALSKSSLPEIRERLGARFGQFTSPLGKRRVEDITNQPIYRRAYEIHDDVLLHNKSEQAKAIDCAAVVYLSELTVTYNAQHAQSPEMRAPFLVCDTDSELFVTLTKLAREPRFRPSLTLHDSRSGVRCFSFQPSTLCSLIFSYASDEWRVDDWPLSDEEARQLKGLGGALADEVPPSDRCRDIRESIDEQHWLNLIRVRWGPSKIVRHEAELSSEIVYETEALKTELTGLAAQLRTAIPDTAHLARAVAWSQRAKEAADAINRYFTRQHYTPLAVRILFRLYDYGFGRQDDLEARLAEALNQAGNNLARALHSLIQRSWKMYRELKEAQQASNCPISPETAMVCERLAILLWIAVGTDIVKDEADDLREFISEIVVLFHHGEVDSEKELAGRAEPSLSVLPVWCIATKVRLANFEFGLNHAQGKVDEARPWADAIHLLAEELQDRWELEDDSLARITIAGPLVRALFYDARAAGRDDDSTDHLISYQFREFFFRVDEGVWAQAVEKARWVKTAIEKLESSDSIKLLAVRNELLYLLCCTTCSLTKRHIEEMHDLASALRTMKSTRGSVWFWHYDDTLAIYCVRLSEHLRCAGDRDGRLHWLRFARDYVRDAVLSGAESEVRIRNLEVCIEELISVLLSVDG
ncbi:MAG TPA: hypothetical protein VHE55_10150 [Fimbriimonadaceae bacterium]|nr:hypothetical protein [Fimbriimonadaceae bacterium]